MHTNEMRFIFSASGYIYSAEKKNGIEGAIRPGAGKGPGAQQQTHTGHFERDLR